MAERIVMTALSPTMEEGVIARWAFKEGDKVTSSTLLCEVETDKATMDYESPADGTLLKIVVAEGQHARVGELIALIGDPSEDISSYLIPNKSVVSEQQPSSPSAVPTRSEGSSAPPEGTAVMTETQSSHKIIASPLARKLAAMKSIDLALVKGSGPMGRVVKRDIETFVGVAPAEQPPVRLLVPEVRPGAQSEKVPLPAKRKVIAQRLSASINTSAHYYLKLSVLLDDLLSVRERLNKKEAEPLSFNAFLLKLTAMTLTRHRTINASFDFDNITYHNSIDIGLAVAQEDGLITPVVRDVAHKGIKQIDRELKDLIARAQNGKLAPSEYQGATFTISNLGSYGIEEFTAIINPPGSAILAVGAAMKEPVVDEKGQIVVKTKMNLTLSCDHRLIDGAVGALFLRQLKEFIEEPVLTLL